MIYVMSDLHGCYDRFLRMLELIEFSENDTLFLLGDYVDRGPAGIKLLLYLMNRRNVICLKGNHDDMFLKKSRYFLPRYSPSSPDDKYSDVGEGRRKTIADFIRLNNAEKEAVYYFVKKMPLFLETEIAGQRFLLSHTVPDKQSLLYPFERNEKDNFIWGEADYFNTYFTDRIIVTGHTPTSFIGQNYKNRIYKNYNHIAVDCGAAFGNNLGCICLNNMKEFYIAK